MGAPVSLLDGDRPTFSAGVVAAAGVVGDTLVLTGSASRTIRVTRIAITGNATVAADLDITLVKRSAIDTGGTSSAVTIAAHDSSDTATATLALYTVAPTAGTSAGIIRAAKVFASTPATAPVIQQWTFGDGPKRALVLRGITQQLAIAFSAVLTGGSFNIDIEWTEE
jgi:hypothetical protein